MFGICFHRLNPRDKYCGYCGVSRRLHRGAFPLLLLGAVIGTICVALTALSIVARPAYFPGKVQVSVSASPSLTNEISSPVPLPTRTPYKVADTLIPETSEPTKQRQTITPDLNGRFKYPTPILVSPLNGENFPLKDQPPKLTWSPTANLESSEYYYVQVFFPNRDPPVCSIFVKSNEIALPRENISPGTLRVCSSSDWRFNVGNFAWHVRIVRRDDRGNIDAYLSAFSITGYFGWHY